MSSIDEVFAGLERKISARVDEMVAEKVAATEVAMTAAAAEFMRIAKQRAPVRKTQDKKWITRSATKNEAKVIAEMQGQSEKAYAAYRAAHPEYEKKYGALTPPMVVARARVKRSPRAFGRPRPRDEQLTRIPGNSKQRIFRKHHGTRTFSTVDSFGQLNPKGKKVTGDFAATRKTNKAPQPYGWGRRAKYELRRGIGMSMMETRGGRVSASRIKYGGTLRNSISAWVETNGNSVTLHASADAHYAKYVEYGTRYMGAQPFFYPAWMQVVGPNGTMLKRRIRR